MPDYRAIFEAIESTLIREGSRILLESEVRSRLDAFKRPLQRIVGEHGAFQGWVRVWTTEVAERAKSAKGGTAGGEWVTFRAFRADLRVPCLWVS